MRWENASEKLGYILFVGAFATICILPVAVMPWQVEKAVGNEQLASFPELRKEDGNFNTGILNDFADYFADHFGFRHEMITLNDWLTEAAFKTLDSNSVLLGKDSWLFYKSTLEDYTGTNLFTARQSYAAAHALGLMQEYCEQNDIDFCFTIAPNKNSMYSSQMPARYAAASVRNAQLLKQQMEQQNVRYIDLFEVLSNSKEQLYYRLDSHWNMRGAQLAAQALLEELKGCEVEFDPFVTGKKLPHTGDLYEMVYPAGSETEQDTAYDFTYQYDEKFHSADDITIHTKNSEADGSVFVYRDSFGINLHPFLAQSYGSACFSRNMPYRLTAAMEEQPDVLLVELVERNLNWLLERAPELPAPERTAVAAADIRTSVKAQREDSRMEDTFCLTGSLSGQNVDDDSPVYILTETAAYEASPCGESEQPFTAYLPQNLREQELKVAFLSDGEWVCCSLID